MDFWEQVKIYELYIEYIRHENELIHQRAGRFVGIQAAFVATLGLIMQKYMDVVALPKVPSTADLLPVYLLILSICIAGLVSSVSAFISLSAARQAQHETYKSYHDTIAPGSTKSFGQMAAERHFPALMGGGAESLNPNIATSDRRGGTFLTYLPRTMMAIWSIALVIIVLFMLGLKVAVTLR